MDLSNQVYTDILGFIKKLAIKAGEEMLSVGEDLSIKKKGEKDLVTEVDLRIENMYKEELGRRFPDFGFLAEEENNSVPEGEYYWVIDPIDGTNNYAHSYPVFCTSVALVQKQKTILAVVYDPNRNELFWADRKGAYLNKRLITPSKISRLSDSLLCTGFAYKFKYADDTNIEHFINFLYAAEGLRRDGSAALDICYVACGRFDGFWELNLKVWDTAASYYILEKAGGMVTDFSGQKYSPFYTEIVASNGLIHSQMLEVLSKGR